MFKVVAAKLGQQVT